MRHQLINNGDMEENLIVIEIQIGVYLGEDDIVRYEDVYGSVKMKFENIYFKGKKHLGLHHAIRTKFYRIFCKVVYQCDIPLETEIDRSVYFCHNAFGVVINPNSIIGGVL